MTTLVLMLLLGAGKPTPLPHLVIPKSGSVAISVREAGREIATVSVGTCTLALKKEPRHVARVMGAVLARIGADELTCDRADGATVVWHRYKLTAGEITPEVR